MANVMWKLKHRKHFIAPNLRKRCIKQRFWRDSRSLPERCKISWLATQNWSNWRNMHPDGRGGAERFHLSHVVRRVYEIQEDLVHLSEHIWQTCTYETTIRLQRNSNKTSSPWVWRRATCTDSFLTVSEMASVVFFIQNLSELVKWAAPQNGATR